MSQSLSSKSDRHHDSDDDNTESDHLSPPVKRRCQTSNSKLCLPEQSSCVLVNLTHFEENNEGCKSCGKQETLLKTFNCPSLHHFCLNCIFIWTQKHVKSKTSPICLVENCGYSLKIVDLDDLPIGIKDHQVLHQLIDLKIDNSNETKSINLRMKCDKCYLYIDQHHFYAHQNECLGRSVTIPCEICFCPVLIHDYEQHMMICNNDDNSAVAQFLYKHLQNPNMDERMIKVFIHSWQRKHRRTIDIYEIIEELNQTKVLFQEICDRCKNTVPMDAFYFLNCDNNHASCIACYKQHLQNQMNGDQILTCYDCTYQLQDKDLADIRLFSDEQKLLFQEYQNRKILEYYHHIYEIEDGLNVNSSLPQPTTRSINHEETSRRRCELCSNQHFYADIFVLNCNCKICYDCFANEMKQQQQLKNEELLVCTLCRNPIKHNDLGHLRLTPAEIQSIQLYQQGKLFEHEHAIHFTRQNNSQASTSHDNDDDDYDLDLLQLNQQQCLPKYWNLPMIMNFSRHPLNAQSTEYKFVADKFNQSWTNMNHLPLLPPPVMTMQPPLPPTNTMPTFFFPNPAPAPVTINSIGPMFNASLPPPPPTHLLRAMPPGNLPPIPLPPPPPITLPPQHIHRRVRRPPSLPINNPTRATNPIVATPQIIQIERVQNQRWYKQYAAHECEFRQKLGKQTEQWLFHGCDERSSKNIEVECFNRSYAGQHAAAYGQGCYFARDSLYSHSFAAPDHQGIRRMFLARVLVGNTCQGNSAIRVPPPGFDTTGDGQSIFVTYHDSQAYAEYLISYR